MFNNINKDISRNHTHRHTHTPIHTLIAISVSAHFAVASFGVYGASYAVPCIPGETWAPTRVGDLSTAE